MGEPEGGCRQLSIQCDIHQGEGSAGDWERVGVQGSLEALET